MTIAEEPTRTSSDDVRIPSPNAHIPRYLDDYLTFPHPPGSAVLLTGPWGSGKTFLARNLVAAHASTPEPVLLVSLYGLTSRQDIIEALVDARYPTLAREREGRDSTHGRRDPGPGGIPRWPEAAGYVFDDLERCSMPIVEAMGFINLLVERGERKAIILANEAGIAERDDAKDWKPTKDKVVGRSFVVKPDFHSAFDRFAAAVDSEPSATLLQAMRHEIQTLFRRSELEDLRVLQRTMWDFERVHRRLRPEHHDNAEAMTSLLRLIFSLSFELRAERLVADDLTDRFAKAHRGVFSNDEPPNRLRQAGNRYPGVVLHDNILPDRVLHDVLVDGLVDGDAVRSALDGSSWFHQEDEASWRTLWYSFERSDDACAAAADALREDFRQRTYDEPGELLHVFGQMLKLTDLGVTGWDDETATAECKRYVDDLRTQDRLRPPTSLLNDTTRHGSFAGLGFEFREQHRFIELRTYLDEQRELAELDRHPRAAEKLLHVLRGDPSRFAEEVGADGPYARAPVLARCDASAIADVLVTLPPMQLTEVLMALSGRYELEILRGPLADELEWAEELQEALLERAGKLQIFGRERIRQMVKATLKERLQDGRTLANRANATA